jgi:hypothetical protein
MNTSSLIGRRVSFAQLNTAVYGMPPRLQPLLPATSADGAASWNVTKI